MAQFFETADESVSDRVALAFIEVVAAQVLIGLSACQEMIRDYENRVGHGHGSAVGTSPGRQRRY